MKLKLAFCLILVLSFACAAQQARRDALPRVGAIKDYPATGLETGCNNYYFAFPSRGRVEEPRYVFLARAKGNDAWMNLNGRDTPLKQIESSRRQNRFVRRFKYRAGEIFITVVIKDFVPKASAKEEDYFMFEAVITLRRGRRARTIKLFGSADC